MTYFINAVASFYEEMNLLLKENDFVSLIMQIFSFILTLITFLTVTMSVQYQEYIYKAKEILFDIKNSIDKNAIKRYIEKLGYIDEERCNYDKCINIFVGISYAILMIIVFIAPIYYVNANNIMIITIGTSLAMFDLTIYLVYKRLNRDTKALTKNDVLNAKNYTKCYNKEVNIFPKIIFNKYDFCVIDTDDINIRNYSVIVKLQYDLQSHSTIIFKRNDQEIEVNDKMYNKAFKLDRMVNEINYYIKIENDWFEYKFEQIVGNNELLIIPIDKKDNFSVDMGIRNCLETAKINEITIFNV